MKVLVGASSFTSKSAMALLNEKGIELTKNPYGRRMTEEEVMTVLPGYDGLLAGLEPLNERVLSACPGLKAVARIGIGTSNVDFEAAKKLNIKVSNTPEGPTAAVAEMTLAALLTIAHRVIPSNADVHGGVWKKRIGFSLDGAKVLVIGYGRIGRRSAELMEKMGCVISVYDPYLPEISAGSLPEAVRDADVISLHASGETEILTPEIIAAVKPGAVILNSARGGLVNEQALFEALQSGLVGWYWGDALWQEPYKGPLTQCENAILTPHICTYTAQCRESMERQAVENLLRDLTDSER